MNQKIVIAGMLSLLFLSACSTEKNESGKSENNNGDVVESQQAATKEDAQTGTKDEQGSEEENQTTTAHDEDEADHAIHFIKKQYTKGNIKVEYPQVTNTDSVKVKTINEVIARDASQFFESGLYEDYSGEIKYETTFLNDEVASFTYQGLLTSPNQSYPVNLFYSTIVNMKTCEKVTLADLVTIDMAFVEAFKQGEILSSSSAEYSDAVKSYITSLSNEELLEELSKADTMDSLSAFTYLTEDSIVVTTGVPHALGDFVQVEILKSHLNIH